MAKLEWPAVRFDYCASKQHFGIIIDRLLLSRGQDSPLNLRLTAKTQPHLQQTKMQLIILPIDINHVRD